MHNMFYEITNYNPLDVLTIQIEVFDENDSMLYFTKHETVNTHADNYFIIKLLETFIPSGFEFQIEEVKLLNFNENFEYYVTWDQTNDGEHKF